MKRTYVHKVKTKLAFTLAEVLIVLGIIGVIAEMTIPTLMHNVQNQVFKTQFKKEYSTVNQAITMTKLNLGVENLPSLYTTYNGTIYVGADELSSTFYSQMRVTGTVSYPSATKNFSNTADSNWLGVGNSYPDHALADGSTVNLQVCASMINISFDTNGLKRPNRVGYDIFVFHVDSNDSVIPFTPDANSFNGNAEISGLPCSTSSSQAGNGMGCGYYALLDKDPGGSSNGYWNSLK